MATLQSETNTAMRPGKNCSRHVTHLQGFVKSVLCLKFVFNKGKEGAGQSMTFRARTLSRIDGFFILKALLYLKVLEKYRLSLFRLFIQ